ncbi:microsomal glutathione S-transferase 2 [Strongylocentrotus purpuratus]|uniref:Microsomal glutathione S-transferase 2 n=1 Tax=Strongylocentrotus purpuratus TaxID=7668 RepID=A0A7M7RCJ0_STRPU|nr:microsomal glutathione S-transferase 2 [Strongylocentrotus purpuratus]XP_788981.1 microsomal glutathione S-transferase 2 [Strongylocentrotus purpuratus]|eukprot:XP_788981.1 PREDICTED: microsomal glutathione S-transferase 2 [Strongylocentrotus purpuratus]
MAPILLESVILPAGVSLMHAFQLTSFARQTGQARRKFDVPYPAITGDERFMRYFRAQQNTIEFAPIFYPLLWSAALFCHPVPAALVGLVYLYGRSQYFKGYVKEVKGRLFGFGVCVNALKLLMAMSVGGIAHFALVTYAGVDVKRMVMARLNL